MALYHVNFHTLHSQPIFENDAYDQMMRECVRDTLRNHKILCPAWELMPTHVHMIIDDFPDLPRSTIMRYVKGSTSHAWTPGYYFVAIQTHRQFMATLQYVRTNRAQADLPPPAPLAPAQ